MKKRLRSRAQQRADQLKWDTASREQREEWIREAGFFRSAYLASALTWRQLDKQIKSAVLSAFSVVGF
jgi:hypothetical protein